MAWKASYIYAVEVQTQVRCLCYINRISHERLCVDSQWDHSKSVFLIYL